MGSHIGSPNKSKDHHAPLEAKYLPLLQLVLEQGFTAVFFAIKLFSVEKVRFHLPGLTVRDYQQVLNPHSKDLQQTPVFE